MMKFFNKMYCLVLALAVVFTLNNCSNDQISPQDVELDKGTKELLAKKKMSYAGGQAGLIFEYGEGWLNGYASFSFHVTMDVDGNVSGSWQSNYNDSMDDTFDINTHGTIDCVIFDGNRAIMAGTLTHVNEGGYWSTVVPGKYAYFEVVDNGEGKNSDSDQFSDIYVGLSYLYCGYDFELDLIDINNGNIQVTNNEMTDSNHGDRANPVIERVSVGGNDICEAWLGLEPGCDGNFSLIAIKKADGTVMGQWQDTWAGAGNGVHVDIDCMFVEENSAVVGGYVTHGSFDGFDLTGLYLVTKVVDNGTSQQDPADQACFTLDPAIPGCQDQPFYFWGYNTLYEALDDNLYDITRGQVKVWSK